MKIILNYRSHGMVANCRKKTHFRFTLYNKTGSTEILYFIQFFKAVVSFERANTEYFKLKIHTILWAFTENNVLSINIIQIANWLITIVKLCHKIRNKKRLYTYQYDYQNNKTSRRRKPIKTESKCVTFNELLYIQYFHPPVANISDCAPRHFIEDLSSFDYDSFF